MYLMGVPPLHVFDGGWGIGVADSKVLAQTPWMTPSLDQVKLLVTHQDQVIDLPSSAELLMSNSFCVNSMFVLGSCMGMQGHPEFSSAYLRDLMHTRRDSIPEETFEKALSNLETPVDDQQVSHWIVSFIRTFS